MTIKFRKPTEEPEAYTRFPKSGDHTGRVVFRDKPGIKFRGQEELEPEPEEEEVEEEQEDYENEDIENS